MKKKELSYYLDLMKSALDKQEWNKAKRYGENALKKLFAFSYSPNEEYLLYCRLGFIYIYLAEYSRSLDVFYKADLIASRSCFGHAELFYPLYMIGINFLRMKNIRQAANYLVKAKDYYDKYPKKIANSYPHAYFDIRINLGYCYLYQNRLDAVKKIIDSDEFSSLSSSAGHRVLDYFHLNGEYLIALKKYGSARQSFLKAIEFSRQFNKPDIVLAVKIHLATIELLEEKPDKAIPLLQDIFKEARRQKLERFVCESGLLLSKVYSLKNMESKRMNLEKCIKPVLNKLDVFWLYEKIHELEQLYQKLSVIYKRDLYSIPDVLGNAVKRQSEVLTNKNIIVGESFAMKDVYQLVSKIAMTELPILIQGETGTGKELIAHLIHDNGIRKGNIWLALNCGAIPEALLENELLGHNKGAFTDAKENKKGYIELASNGTLFLDEIADMSPSMQQKLLRVMDEKLVWRLGAEKPIPIDTRFIFASNQNIEELVKAKKFREDLYYRINTIVITLPPLCDRKEDIPLLINHFLTKYSGKTYDIQSPTHDIQRTTPDALRLLTAYPWPGNVRELENEMKRICTVYPELKIITESMLTESIKAVVPSRSDLTMRELTDSFQKNVIENVLKKNRDNITKTARQLGYTRSNLYLKMNQLKIKPLINLKNL